MRKLITTTIILVALIILPHPVKAASSLSVYYSGPVGGVLTALKLANFDIVADPSQAPDVDQATESPIAELIREMG